MFVIQGPSPGIEGRPVGIIRFHISFTRRKRIGMAVQIGKGCPAAAFDRLVEYFTAGYRDKLVFVSMPETGQSARGQCSESPGFIYSYAGKNRLIDPDIAVIRIGAVGKREDVAGIQDVHIFG